MIQLISRRIPKTLSVEAEMVLLLGFIESFILTNGYKLRRIREENRVRPKTYGCPTKLIKLPRNNGLANSFHGEKHDGR